MTQKHAPEALAPKVRPNEATADGNGNAQVLVEDELAPAERSLVDAAVAYINEAVNRSGAALAAEVSRFVLDRFFNGDYQAFLDPSRYKSRSFTALCRREDLALSHASLYALVRVGQQFDTLPDSVAHALTLKHHRALLPLSDPAERTRLAEQAVAERWTAAQLIAAVRATRPASSRGRTPLPPVLKAVRALRRAVVSPPEATAVASLSAAQREEITAHIADVEAHLGALRAALQVPMP